MVKRSVSELRAAPLRSGLIQAVSPVRILFASPPSPRLPRGLHNLAKIRRFIASFCACRSRRDAISAGRSAYFEESLCRPVARSTPSMLSQVCVLSGPPLHIAPSRVQSGFAEEPGFSGRLRGVRRTYLNGGDAIVEVVPRYFGKRLCRRIARPHHRPAGFAAGPAFRPGSRGDGIDRPTGREGSRSA